MTKIKFKTLTVAAYTQELLHLCKFGNKHFVMQDGNGFLAAGIGPVAASFGLTHCLKDHAPEIIITLGTAGIINTGKFKIGDIVLAQKVSTDSASPDVYTPEKNGNLECPLPSMFENANVFCPQEITCSEARRTILLGKNYDIENLEAYAFYFVAKKFQIPIMGFLGLTNIAGPNAHEEWKKNETEVCEKLSQIIKEKINF